MKKPMTNDLRKKIAMYIKNHIDISDLIKDTSIKGENLSRAIIKDFSRPGDDISGCNLCEAVIGEEDKITNLNNIIGQNANFQRAIFKGTIWLRRANIRNCNLKGAFVPRLDYRFSDLRGCNFCDIVFNTGSSKATGAILDENFFKGFAEQWGVEITMKKSKGGK